MKDSLLLYDAYQNMKAEEAAELARQKQEELAQQQNGDIIGRIKNIFNT